MAQCPNAKRKTVNRKSMHRAPSQAQVRAALRYLELSARPTKTK